MIKISHERGVQIIELSRPDKKNAFCRSDVSMPLHTSPRLAELSGVAGTLDKDGYLLQA